MLVAIYCRVSTREQAERETILTQLEICSEFCARHGLSVFDHYRDENVSGTVPFHERPEGRRLLEDARAGHFTQVVFYKLNRVGRDVLITLQAGKALEDLGVTLVSATETLDRSSASGRAMSVMTSVFGQLEREDFLDRSRASTRRLARDGVWLGGIVPFAYRVVGKGKDARLQISDQPIEGLAAPGLEMSERDVIQLIYRLIADEGRSCRFVADRLNALGVLPAYARDGREVHVGKRTQRTQTAWRASRIRNMIVNSTYKGVHRYGSRSKSKHPPIERSVPAIVDEATWERAQSVLHNNMRFSRKNARRRYLLRGLIQCGQCGSNYSGTAYPEHHAGVKMYYSCNGRQRAQGANLVSGQKCHSKAISGVIEELVWTDVSAFLRDPGQVLQHLADSQPDTASRTQTLTRDLSHLRRALDAKAEERNNVTTLFRRGLIDLQAVETQLEQVREEEDRLRAQIEATTAQLQTATGTQNRLRDAQTLLRELQRRIEGPLTWEQKRQVIECLVERICVDTRIENGKKQATVTAYYRFDRPTGRDYPHDRSPEPAEFLGPFTGVATRTDTDSPPQ